MQGTSNVVLPFLINTSEVRNALIGIFKTLTYGHTHTHTHTHSIYFIGFYFVGIKSCEFVKICHLLV